MLILAFIGVFIVGACIGMLLTALIVANDDSRGHPL